MLTTFLTAESLWNQLVIYNESKLLCSWINFHYSQSSTHATTDNIQKLFMTYPITQKMIQELYRPDAAPTTRENVLNELCKFGIFCKQEQENLINLLKRLVQSGNIRFIHEILQKHTSNVKTEQFLNVLVTYCTDNNLLTVLNACLENFQLPEHLITGNVVLDLITDCRNIEKYCSRDFLTNNIYKISKYLSKDNLEAYFSDNPIILLSIILLTRDIDFTQVIEKKKITIFKQTFSDSISNMCKHYKLLELIYNRKTVVQNCDLTYYDMLSKHLSVDVKKLFAYHFENKPHPNFEDRDFIAKYGYNKQINQIFYVREQRPGIACKYFLIDQYRQFGRINEDSVKILKKKIYKLALKNVNIVEIAASCVAFLEMVGLGSEFVRVSLTGAKMLLDLGHDFESVVELFLDVEEDPLAVLKVVEDKVS